MHGRTAKILALNEAGKTYDEIATEMGCTKSNISQTLKRHREWNRTVAPIPKAHHDWIVKHARKNGMLPPLYVAQLLVKIIDEELQDDE